MILQRRVFPFNTSFDRNWEDYRTGFGNLTGEFCLGKDNIHRLAATPVSFLVELHEGGKKLYAKYENFVVAGADDKYRWNMDSYSAICPMPFTDSIRMHNTSRGECSSPLPTRTTTVAPVTVPFLQVGG